MVSIFGFAVDKLGRNLVIAVLAIAIILFLIIFSSIIGLNRLMNVTPAAAAGLTTPTISPVNPSAAEGQTITFTASVSGGTPPYLYYWYEGYSPNCSSDTTRLLHQPLQPILLIYIHLYTTA